MHPPIYDLILDLSAQTSVLEMNINIEIEII